MQQRIVYTLKVMQTLMEMNIIIVHNKSRSPILQSGRITNIFNKLLRSSSSARKYYDKYKLFTHHIILVHQAIQEYNDNSVVAISQCESVYVKNNIYYNNKRLLHISTLPACIRITYIRITYISSSRNYIFYVNFCLKIALK